MRTRAKPPKAATTSTTASESRTIVLPPSDLEPPSLVILPRQLSDSSRVVSLPDPVTLAPKRYLVCPKSGFYEFTKVTAPRSTPRSWLLKSGEEQDGTDDENPTRISTKTAAEHRTPGDGYLLKEPDLLIATPFDPMFLLLQALTPAANAGKQMFLALDDYLDVWTAKAPHARHLVEDTEVRNCIEASLSAVCDHVDAGDEKMYRLSKEKLTNHLLEKAKRASATGLPKSMEDHFVNDALKYPLVAFDSSEAVAKTDSFESQESADSGYASATPVLEASAGPPAATPLNPTPFSEIRELQRLRVALDFILSSYVSPHVQTMVRESLAATKTVDFSPLDTHLSRLDELKSQSQVLRNLSENINRKRAADDDDEAAELRAEKKRKKEEEEAKKKSETRALKQLKKVDTSGMKKLSSFFVKKPAK